MHFSKKSDRLSSAGPEIQAFVSHCSANFQPILNCFIPNFKLKYEESENIKADRVSTVVFNINQTSDMRSFFLGGGGGGGGGDTRLWFLISEENLSGLFKDIHE